jgi:hypothetical protein
MSLTEKEAHARAFWTDAVPTASLLVWFCLVAVAVTLTFHDYCALCRQPGIPCPPDACANLGAFVGVTALLAAAVMLASHVIGQRIQGERVLTNV